jgi:negative regulator of sigma E activity
MWRLNLKIFTLKVVGGYSFKHIVQSAKIKIMVPQRPERVRIDQKKLSFDTELEGVAVAHRSFLAVSWAVQPMFPSPISSSNKPPLKQP